MSHSLIKVVLWSRDGTLVRRSPDSTTSSGGSFTCGPKDTTGPCERMVESNPIAKIAPVVLGVVIPLVVAMVVLIVLHRRHVRKLQQEEAEDKHKSLDFGLDGAIFTEKRGRGRGGHQYPETGSTHGGGSRKGDRGLSLDLSMSNPYLLPPELQQSRESLHSLSRSFNSGDDKYRATNFIPDDGSLRSPSSIRGRDDASIYTYSSRHKFETESTKGLIPTTPRSLNGSVPILQEPNPAVKGRNVSPLTPEGLDLSRESHLNSVGSNGLATGASNSYHDQYVKSEVSRNGEAGYSERDESLAELDGNVLREELREPPAAVLRDNSDQRNSVAPAPEGFDFGIPPNTYELSSGPEPALPHVNVTPADGPTVQIHEAPTHEVEIQDTRQASSTREMPTTDNHLQPRQHNQQANNPQIKVAPQYEDQSGYYEDDDDDVYDISEYKDVLGYDPRLLTMGMRPLPPDDPSENPEERALRIRSFYKEYFEDTGKPGGDKARLSYFDPSDNYIDDYYGSQHQPMYGNGRGGRAPTSMSYRGPAGRHRATVSNGSYLAGGPGPRAYSSASQRLPGSNKLGPKKNLPPPKPLNVLRNPAMMNDESMLLNPIDFAPPQAFKNDRAGTPDSQASHLRPYSPSVRPFTPLVSSFDDLSVLPSPHQLRKSGTFTSLDFAPPRFGAASHVASDAGSIRSNKSGMSAMQLHNIRAGAYRLSRIPKNLAGTKEELASALKPQWNNAR